MLTTIPPRFRVLITYLFRGQRKQARKLDMDISKSVASLEACLDHVPRLKSLAYNPKNPELTQWNAEVERILIDTFGQDSKEYARYEGIHILKRINTREEKEQAYIAYISQREMALKDIIKSTKYQRK